MLIAINCVNKEVHYVPVHSIIGVVQGIETTTVHLKDSYVPGISTAEPASSIVNRIYEIVRRNATK